MSFIHYIDLPLDDLAKIMFCVYLNYLYELFLMIEVEQELVKLFTGGRGGCD